MVLASPLYGGNVSARNAEPRHTSISEPMYRLVTTRALEMLPSGLIVNFTSSRGGNVPERLFSSRKQRFTDLLFRMMVSMTAGGSEVIVLPLLLVVGGLEDAGALEAVLVLVLRLEDAPEAVDERLLALPFVLLCVFELDRLDVEAVPPDWVFERDVVVVLREEPVVDDALDAGAAVVGVGLGVEGAPSVPAGVSSARSS